MSLYDDDDLGAPPTEVAMGWSSGLKMMQSTLQAKKVKQTLQAPSSMGPPKTGSAPTFAAINKHRTFSTPILAPVIDLKSKNQKTVEEPLPTTGTKAQFSKPESRGSSAKTTSSGQIGIQSFNEPNFLVTNEYDPHWPNDYHKVILEMRGDKSKEDDNDASESKKRRYTEDGRAKARERFSREDASSASGNGTMDDGSRTDSPTGFGRRPRDDYEDEDDEDSMDRRRKANASSRRSQGSTTGGAAIAPPPSLTETTNPAASGSPPPPQATSDAADVPKMKPSPFAAMMKPGNAPGLGVAAKIMAKYGYKQGSGLGRSEQGMSQALTVEKTSRRGGKIIHEKDLMPPPMFGESFKTKPEESATPPRIEDTVDEYGDPVVNTNTQEGGDQENAAQNENKPSITDLMRNPSKVVLCQNMVGPGEVDEELEPEIKDECEAKYGDVQKVVIFEIPNAAPEDAVRIFTEFKRVESAIKAVVDLNGRFFGGREVRASFYDVEKFKNLKLDE